MRRRPGQRMTPDEQRHAQDNFLSAYKRSGSKNLACEEAGIHRNTPNYWEKRDASFGRRYRIVREMWEEQLLDEIRLRLVRGGVLGRNRRIWEAYQEIAQSRAAARAFGEERW